METLDLINIPLPSSYKNVQRCYIGPEAMKKLNLKIRDVVVLTKEENKQFICVIWPRSDRKKGFIQFDSSVTLTFDTFRMDEAVLETSCQRRHYDICPVRNIKRLSKLNIRLLKNVSSDCNDISHLQTVLENVVVRKDCIVSLKHFKPFSSLLGISAISIESYSIESGATLDEQLSADEHHIKDPTDFECGIITQRTEINVVGCSSLEKIALAAKEKMSHVGALSKEHKLLKNLIDGCFSERETFKQIGITVPKGILLHGPPGVGKTLLVKSIAEDCMASIVLLNGSDIFGPRPGESEENLRKAFQKAQKKAANGAVILFIDELDALCPKRGMDSGSHENRVVAQLLTVMDGIGEKHDFVVIGATNRPNAIDPALRRPGRFDREIVISVPSREQRQEILQIHTNKLHLASSVKLDRLAEMTNGYVGADLASLCREASFQALHRINLSTITAGHQTKPIVNWDDFQQALGLIAPSTQRQASWKVDLRPVSWEDIGGLDDVKSKLKQDLEWPLQHAESFVKLGIQTPRGVLLYGPPGCCKTTLVKAAATSCNATFFSVSAAQLFSPYVGDSEKTVAEIFHHARIGAPSIIFLDEIDSIIGNRSQGGKKGVQQRVLSTLLTEMDGLGVSIQDRVGRNEKICEEDETELNMKVVKNNDMNKNVIVVAATNRPELIDSAIMRPGRLDRIVYVPPPDYEARLRILQVYTKKIPQTEELNLEEIAKETVLYSGADLENLCREAALTALQQDGLGVSGVTQSHFKTALITTKPSLSTSQVEKYSKFANGKN